MVLKPTIPHIAAGWRTLPQVSVPRAAIAISAATATADPQLLPHGMRLVPFGFFTGQNADVSLDPPIANSSMLAAHRGSAQALRRFSIQVAV